MAAKYIRVEWVGDKHGYEPITQDTHFKYALIAAKNARKRYMSGTIRIYGLSEYDSDGCRRFEWIKEWKCK